MSAESTTTPADYFKAGQRKTIALIVAGVLIIGGLGALASLVSGGGETDEVPTSGIDGESVFETGAGELPAEPAGLSRTPSLLSQPERADDDDERTVEIGDDIEIPVPRPWKVVDKNKDRVLLRDGKGSGIYAFVGSTESTDAFALVPDVKEFVLPGDLYTDVETTEPKALQALGSIVSIAEFYYRATAADQQSSIRVIGAVGIAIRQDGTILVLNPEHTPPGEWEDSIESWGPVVNGALNLFAGL